MDKTMWRCQRLEMMRASRMLPAVVFSLLMLLALPGLAAAQYVFQTIDEQIDDPRRVDTFADGLSTHEIVGEFTDQDGNTHGFMLSKGVSTVFDAPDADGYTSVNGVNARGDHCGIYFVDGHFRAYFLSKAGVFTPLDHPGEISSLALSVNAQGQVAGYYVDAATRTRNGFVWQDGVFTPIAFPDAGPGGTAAVGINDLGQVVGFYGDKNHRRHGFLLSNGVYTPITVPGISDEDFTNAQGINNAGDIVGFYGADVNDPSKDHGFLLRDGVYTPIDVPDSLGTDVYGINAKGEIVGAYGDKDGIHFHGFLGTPVRGPKGK